MLHRDYYYQVSIPLKPLCHLLPAGFVADAHYISVPFIYCSEAIAQAMYFFNMERCLFASITNERLAKRLVNPGFNTLAGHIHLSEYP